MSHAVPLSMGWFCPTLGDTSAFGDPSKAFPQSMEHFERVTRAAENAGFDYMLVPVTPYCWDAWVAASFVVSRTSKIKALIAVKPGFIHPVAQAKMISSFDQMSNGRIYINLIAGLSEKDAIAEGQLGSKEARYEQLEEEVVIIKKLLSEEQVEYSGKYYKVEDAVLQPKPKRKPVIYAGGESERAKQVISTQCDAYVMHGDEPARIKEKIDDMKHRRAVAGLPPMSFGVAGYTIIRKNEEEVKREIERITDVQQSAAGYGNYQDWLANTKLEQQVSLEDYSVSNRGLRSGLTGTPDQVAERVAEFEAAGVDLLLLQCSPQIEEMERFSEAVISRSNVRALAA